MAHHDRIPWRKSIAGDLPNPSTVETSNRRAAFPFRTTETAETDSNRIRHYLHRFFEELLRRSEH